ncbi:hypothetical protein [Streptomonospora litoralis]|uniref:Uncharacterized protein n=1 Tax=Streptomonospora litoralis TaxID=2498135 RepID=A0A4P6Q643_9ACTN|nr:hypothetical protein [Streptomonospora litoralis]QBI56228.1 hypothetical protein EKD16_22375 [Streptomonospora litoralis]
MKKNRPLVRQPERLWARVFKLLPDWDRISFADSEDGWSAYLVIDPDGEITHLLCAALYQQGAEGLPLSRLVRDASSILAGLEGAHEPVEQDEVAADESMSLAVRRMAGVLVALGAAERFRGSENDDCLRASPAGIRGLYDFYTAQGFTAYGCAELAAEPAELVVALVSSGLAGDEAVMSWIAARSQGQAAAELADLADRTDDSEHRAIALHMAVQETGETGLHTLYERADSSGAGGVRSWLATNGYLSVEKLDADDWLVGLLDNLESLIGLHDPQQPVPPELTGAESGLADTLAELPGLVHDKCASTRVRAGRIAEEFALAEIDPEITAAAERALVGLRE